MVAAVDAHQQVVFPAQKVATEHFAQWAQRHLKPSDQVALEATTNAWEFHDQLTSLVASVAVANCHQIKLISASARKTDKQDALVLAKLLAAQLLPTVWVPPQQVRELRSLTAHRAKLIGERSAAKNRLHGLLHQHNVKVPEGNPFTASQETWWNELPLSPVEQLQVHHLWLTIHHLNQLIVETEAAIAQLSVTESWDEDMTFLMQLPGVGLYTGMTILAAIGDIARFPTSDQLVGYAGLGARVHASGDSYQTGKISKQGRTELRTALIACAWVAVRWSDHWRLVFHSLAKRIGKQKAITAVARKLLVVIWHILTHREVDHHANAEAIARSFMTWASHHHLAHANAIHRLDFVRQRLARLGLLQQTVSFRANGRIHYLAAPS
jgi:transposase